VNPGGADPQTGFNSAGSTAVHADRVRGDNVNKSDSEAVKRMKDGSR